MKPTVVTKSIFTWVVFAYACLILTQPSLFNLIIECFWIARMLTERIGVSDLGLFRGELFGFRYTPWSEVKGLKFSFGGKFWIIKVQVEGKKKDIVLSERGHSGFFEICREIQRMMPEIEGHEKFADILTAEREAIQAKRFKRLNWFVGIMVGLMAVSSLALLFLK